MTMEDIGGGLHPAVDGQSLDEDEDEPNEKNGRKIHQTTMLVLHFNCHH